jgi:hemin uptake protein HemP
MSSPEPVSNSRNLARSSAPRIVREVASSELLRGANELLIRHGDELYRLKLTRNGKLILQK